MKVLVIGTGFGAHVMAPAFERAGFTAQVVSPRDEGAVAGGLREKPNLVAVHSPPFLHSHHVLMALDNGIAVLCDKPFGLDAADARRMRDRAHQLGLPNFVNFELRWRPARVKVGQLLAEGAIGRLRHLDWTMFGDGLRRQAHGWLFDAALGGGWIGAYGAHCIDAVCFWTGQGVARCGGIARTEVPTRRDRDGIARDCTAEDAFSIWLELDDGATVSIDSGYSAAANFPERVLLFGESGAIELVGDESVTVHRAGAAAPEVFGFTAPAGDSYALPMAAWLGAVREALRTGAPASPGFDDGVANTEVLDRLRHAIRVTGTG
jgi:predicted dehydrogenase